jgi:hypothetical protein
MLIFPQCSKRISIAKTIHEMHIYIQRTGNSGLFEEWARIINRPSWKLGKEKKIPARSYLDRIRDKEES